MSMKLGFYGLDECLARIENLKTRLFLVYVGGVLEQAGKTITEEMKADHGPGGHPPGGFHGPMPVFGKDHYQDVTGGLTRSIDYGVESWNEGQSAKVLIWASAPYAEAVEFGTYKSRPYPFFWPTILKHMPKIEADLQVAVTAAFDAASDTPGAAR